MYSVTNFKFTLTIDCFINVV